MDIPREQTPLLRLLWQRHVWLRSVTDQVLREAIDVEVRQSHITLLSQLPDAGLPSAELARRLDVAAPTAHQWVRELVDLGILSVDPAPGSRREKLVTLTPTGRELREQALDVVRAVEERLRTTPGVDVDGLRSLLGTDWGDPRVAAAGVLAAIRD